MGGEGIEMPQESYDDIYELVKSNVELSRDEFEELVDRVYMLNEGKISRRAAAILVAKKFGVDTTDIMYPPIIGRLIEVGPVRKAKSPSGITPFVLFAIVNENQRVQGVAFGEHHVNLLRANEDKPLLIRGYTKARLERYSGIKITERSIIKILDESTVPPLISLAPAWLPSLKSLKETKGAWLVRAVVIDQATTEYTACPLCGKAVDMVDDKWICSEHGEIDMPKSEKIWRFMLSDGSGVFVAVYFRELPYETIVNREIVLKGYFKDDELYIMRIYKVSAEEVVKVE